jgi:hypothetical protein
VTDFKKLDFGAPAAERDIDRGLGDYFVESEAFNRVLEGKKTILLGNRGMGKSAIFKVLAKRRREQGHVVIELAPEDYSYEMMASVMAAESEGSWAKLGAYAVAWKYLIYVLVMKEMTRTGPRLKRGDAALVYNYLRDNHKGEADTPIGTLISFVKRMEGVKLGPMEASLKAKALQAMYKLEDLSPLLPALKRLTEQRSVHVFVDELDRGWDASEDAQSFVAGLFQACATLNNLSSGLHVYMSLRQELYDSIPTLYEDAQKYRDILEVISWDEPALRSLMAKRIRYSLPDWSEASDVDAWNGVFAETLQFRQTKSFNYMVDRTLYRPRELIQFATQAIDLVQRTPESFPVDYSILARAETAYSQDRAQDIAAEYRFQYPGLLSVLETFRGKVYAFTREAVLEHCLAIAVGEVAVDPSAAWVADADPDRLVEILWRVGFLRARAVGGEKGRRRSGSSYVGAHQVGYLNLQNVAHFHVHPMFRAYLGLKEPKGGDATPH